MTFTCREAFKLHSRGTASAFIASLSNEWVYPGRSGDRHIVLGVRIRATSPAHHFVDSPSAGLARCGPCLSPQRLQRYRADWKYFVDRIVKERNHDGRLALGSDRREGMPRTRASIGLPVAVFALF